ncbi:MAG: transposase [Chloroflexia bacterium]|nr:transposase [Chloroflexia bacterium]
MSGRRRHLLVDTIGLVLTVQVHPADVADRDGARKLLTQMGERFPRLVHLWADAGYQGRFVTWATEILGWTVEVVRTPLKRRGSTWR